MAYTKLHATILDSSVWLEPAHVRLVWITMLAMADQHGVVHASIGGLAHRARVTREECSEAIARFLGPDPDSRDRTTGERIEEVPGGWLVLNHANYRDKQTHEQGMTAARVAKHRAKQKERSDQTVTERYVTEGNAVKRLSASASASASETEGERERGPEVATRPDDVPEQLWREWLSFRKAKKAPATKLVLDTTRTKATAAGMTMAEAITYWISNGQTGFFPPAAGGERRPGGGSKPAPVVAGRRVEHPANMPVPFNSPIDPCYCGACEAARGRSRPAAARSGVEAVHGGTDEDRGAGDRPEPF